MWWNLRILNKRSGYFITMAERRKTVKTHKRSSETSTQV
ncbi:hypothetical protein MCC93_08660 [Morococcus cerebrosus]|uniref:Uncharacterized protein n=1 Tax=Morococcus cerebrosus TaxID=1056807 RepID=A0A0C1ELK6_9NEIS|nr:hypothetical protein MCC93_08660 [Morococcus cerebrosus]